MDKSQKHDVELKKPDTEHTHTHTTWFHSYEILE